jgi:starch-binding outer membrane protein, SusD/RagB family
MKGKILLTMGLVAGVLFACEEDLNKTNPSVFTTDSYFSNNAELETGVNAIYSSLTGNNLWGREYWFLNDLRGDECTTGGAQLEPPRAQVLFGTLLPSNSVSGAVWNGWYRLMHRTNVVIAAQNNYKTLSKSEEDVKNRIVGEAKLFRSMAFYELTSMWGEVPVYTKPAAAASDVVGRIKQDEILTQAIKDATEAAAVLPESYSGSNIGRVTRYAANLMAARCMMFKGDYAGAKTELLKIKNSGKFKLVDSYLDNFLEAGEYNAESIFEIGFNSEIGMNWDNGDGDNLSWSGPRKSSIRHQEYSPVGWRNVIPSDKFINEFERPSLGDTKRDPRMNFNLYFKGDVINNGKGKLEIDYPVQGNTSKLDGVEQKISWRKYSAAYKTADGYFELNGNNMRIMRYAEVLISLAECENETGSVANAIAALNEVRARKDVEMPKYPTARYKASNKDEVFEAIQHEKLVEMGAEQLRAKDIVRWRKQGKLKKEPLDYFQAKHALLPIPTAEMDNNPNLNKANNPGY